MNNVYPLRLKASLHETIWGGRRLERDGWKQLPANDVSIGESWETELHTLVQNGSYADQSLGKVVEELGSSLLGTQAEKIFGRRFPLLAKFIDANAQLSVQVHPNDDYARQYEGGKLGKTEFWYILAAEPDARIVYGFKAPTSREAVAQAINDVQLEQLLHEETVQAGDVIFVPAGTVHAIGKGVLLYELQEYSDVTYRLYDYGRLTASGTPRELHIDRSLEVSFYEVPRRIKVHPVNISNHDHYEDRCLVACQYFVARELLLNDRSMFDGTTTSSCIILTCLGDYAEVRYGDQSGQSEQIQRGETMILPATLGTFQIVGRGQLLFSYVPEPTDPAWQQWQQHNQE